MHQSTVMTIIKSQWYFLTHFLENYCIYMLLIHCCHVIFSLTCEFDITQTKENCFEADKSMRLIYFVIILHVNSVWKKFTYIQINLLLDSRYFDQTNKLIKIILILLINRIGGVGGYLKLFSLNNFSKKLILSYHKTW